MMRYKPVRPTVFLIEPLLLNSVGFFTGTLMHLLFIKTCLVALLLSFTTTSSEEHYSNRQTAQVDQRFCLFFCIVDRVVHSGETVCVPLLS